MTDPGPRWDALFDDLDAQAAALERAERAGEIDERTRAEIGALTAADRLRAALGAAVRVQLAGQFAVAGTISRVGPEWALLEGGEGGDTVVALAHVLGVRGLPRAAATGDGGVVAARFGLRLVLRGIARDRAPVRIRLADGVTVTATIDRVGADFVDVAEHAAGELRRRQDVRGVTLIPLAAIAAVSRS